MVWKYLKTCTAMSLIVMMMAACSSNGKENSVAQVPDKAKEPVELTFYYMYADSSYEQFMEEHGSLIQKK